MGGGGQSQNSTTTTEPWKGQQPYLTKGFEEAGRLYKEGPAEYFPGSTFVPMSGQTQQGLWGTEYLAGQQGDINDNAAAYGQNVLKGNYLNPATNPYLQQTYDAAAGRLNEDFSENTLPSIASMFGTSGGVGNSSLALAAGDAGGDLTRSKADLAANIYGNNFQQERGRQQDIAGMAGKLREGQYYDQNKLLETGKAYEDFGARQLEDSINRWNYQQNAPMAHLQDYLALISGNYGSTSTTRQSAKGGSPLATGLGGLGLFASLLG